MDKQDAPAAEDNPVEAGNSADSSNGAAADSGSAESMKHNTTHGTDETRNSLQQSKEQHRTPAQPEEEALQRSSGGHE